MSKTVPILTVLVVFGLLMAACTPTPTEPPASPSPEVASLTTVVPVAPLAPGSIEAVSRLDPALLTGTEDAGLSAHIYEGLVGIEGGQVVPQLATGFTVSEDGLEYTFELQRGVTFQDGTAFNADAVLANFNRWSDPQDPLHGNGEYAGWLQYFLAFEDEKNPDGTPVSFYDGVEKVDDITVLFHLNRPEASFPNYLAAPYFAIASPTLLAQAGAEYGTSPETVAGTGPYRVGNWSESGLTLLPFDGYRGTPASETLEFTFK